MSIDLNEMLNKDNKKADDKVTPTVTPATKEDFKKDNSKEKLTYAVVAVLGLGAIVGAYQLGSKKDDSETPTSAEVAKEVQKLPDGVKEVQKLPFDMPEFFKGQTPQKIYKVGSIYVVGTQDENGNLVYDSLSQDGKFLMATYIADSKTGQVIMTGDGFVTDDTQAQVQPQNQAQMTGETMGLQAQSYYKNGLSPAFFTGDLTAPMTGNPNVNTPAIGTLQNNPDLFARHVIDSVYSTMWHSDSRSGKYKNSAHQPIYVFYDPNCVYCQNEVPQLTQLDGYHFVYVPVPVLSSAPDANSDDDFHYQLFAPHLGKQDLLATLTSKTNYKRPDGFTMTDEQKGYGATNRGVFMDIANILTEYYQGKYGANMTSAYGAPSQLSVPSVLYIDRQTGDVKYSGLEDELLGVSLQRQ